MHKTSHYTLRLICDCLQIYLCVVFDDWLLLLILFSYKYILFSYANITAFFLNIEGNIKAEGRYVCIF